MLITIVYIYNIYQVVSRKSLPDIDSGIPGIKFFLRKLISFHNYTGVKNMLSVKSY